MNTTKLNHNQEINSALYTAGTDSIKEQASLTTEATADNQALPEQFNKVNEQTNGLFAKLATKDAGLKQLGSIVTGMADAIDNLRNFDIPAAQSIEDTTSATTQLLDYLNSAEVGGEYGKQYALLSQIVNQHQQSFTDAKSQLAQLAVLNDTNKQISAVGNEYTTSSVFGGSDVDDGSNFLSDLSKNGNPDFILMVCIAVILMVARQQGQVLKNNNDSLTANSGISGDIVKAQTAFNDLAGVVPYEYTDTSGKVITINTVFDLIRFANGQSCNDGDGNKIVTGNIPAGTQQALFAKMTPLLSYLQGFKDPETGTSYLEEMLTPDSDKGPNAQTASHNLFTGIMSKLNQDLAKLNLDQIAFFPDNSSATGSGNGIFKIDTNILGAICSGLSQGATSADSLNNTKLTEEKTNMASYQGWFDALGSIISALKELFQAVGRA